MVIRVTRRPKRWQGKGSSVSSISVILTPSSLRPPNATPSPPQKNYLTKEQEMKRRVQGWGGGGGGGGGGARKVRPLLFYSASYLPPLGYSLYQSAKDLVVSYQRILQQVAVTTRTHSIVYFFTNHTSFTCTVANRYLVSGRFFFRIL